jgi:hypothetical protein
MNTITIKYPNKSYTLTVTDAQAHMYNTLIATEGERSANVYGRKLVLANRVAKKTEPKHSVVQPTMVCVNRECAWCGNEECTTRHSAQR